MPYEANLWKRLRDQTKPLVAKKQLHMCRVENWIGPGYPDVEGCFRGNNFHLELKGSLRPANPATPVRVKWQPGQRPWLKRRWAAGGSCFVLLRVGMGAGVKHYLICGNRVDYVGSVPESELEENSLIHPKTGGCKIVKCAATWRKENGI